MVQNIATALIIEAVANGLNLPDYDTAKIIANQILTTMESAGMNPPTVPKGTPWHKFKDDYGLIQQAHLAYDVNQWESEDQEGNDA